jgi:hypothetical protein
MARELTRAGAAGRRPEVATMETAPAMETAMEVSMETTMMSASGGSDGLVDPWQ